MAYRLRLRHPRRRRIQNFHQRLFGGVTKNFDPKSMVDFKGHLCRREFIALARTIEYFRIRVRC